MHYDTMEMPLPETERMKLEKLIDEKDREINELKLKLKNSPKPLTEDEWGEHFSGCQDIGETFDMMIKFGFISDEE